MRKIIAIGESVVDTVFSGGKPLAAFIGGRIANTAASLGAMGLPVSMVSECGTDSVGQMVVDFLSEHRVDVKSIDRFTEGSTAFSAIFKTPGEADKIVNYGSYPNDRFDVIWPRIDEGDIVVFGSLYAIDLPQRERLFELVSYASERKAIIIYLPGFQHGINFRITRVMPNILENLEISDIVIAHNRDINDIFPGESCEEAFRNHIEFYCSNYMHINPDLSLSRFSTGKRHDVANEGGASTNLLGWQAGFTAGIVSELCRLNIGRDELKTLDDEVWQGITAAAFKCAAVCAAQSDNCVTADFAAECQSQLAQAEAERQKQ
ncbi:MAG: PfkB family carbohydrate kinase [Bacteroidales bacterium]|nr:PfkB family carbohydrate kinase [Bacteroidales bacterium]MDY3913203.1 PfkB family carbohydrate kinase [Sodaliphilus sp.]